MKQKVYLVSVLFIFTTFSCEKSENFKEEQTNEPKKGVMIEDGIYREKQDSYDSTDYTMNVIDLDRGLLKSTQSYFSDLAVYIGNNPSGLGDSYNGYVRVENVDLNEGAGGAYIYLYCKIQPSYSTAINGIKIATSSFPIMNIPNNYSSFRLFNYTGNPLAKSNLNYGSGGKYIYGYYSYCDMTFPRILDGIGVISGSSSLITPPSGWEKINVDLNTGAGGKYIYLIVKMSLLKPLVLCN